RDTGETQLCLRLQQGLTGARGEGRAFVLTTLVLVQRELESRSCPNWIRRCEATRLVASGRATDTSRLELAIPRRPDLAMPAGQGIVWRHVADGTVQPARVVLLHEVPDHPPRVLQAQRRLGADGLGFQRAVPALDLAIRLRIVRRRAHMVHPAQADKVLEIASDELRAVVADEARRRLGVFLLRL